MFVAANLKNIIATLSFYLFSKNSPANAIKVSAAILDLVSFPLFDRRDSSFPASFRGQSMARRVGQSLCISRCRSKSCGFSSSAEKALNMLKNPDERVDFRLDFRRSSTLEGAGSFPELVPSGHGKCGAALGKKGDPRGTKR